MNQDRSPEARKSEDDQELLFQQRRESEYSDYSHVEISGGGEDSGNVLSTSTALNQCEKKVLNPYLGLLKILGWRPVVQNVTIFRRTFNQIYLLFIFSLLIASYVLKIFVCDSSIATGPTISTPHVNRTGLPTRVPAHSIVPAATRTWHCRHLFTTYLIPESIHGLAYVYLFYHFRIKETEQLSSLVQTVFLQSCNIQSTRKSQRKLITILRMFLVLGCVWVGMTVLSICLQVANQYVNKSERGNVNYNDWQITVVVCGHFIVNLVYMAIALNYCTQCQLLIHYVQYILLCIQERSLELKRVMQDVFKLKRFVSRLNGQMATATSLCLFSQANWFLFGFVNFLKRFYNDRTSSSAISWTHAALFPLLWLFALAPVLIQASRLTTICSKLRFSGLTVRLFGYQNCSPIDLDSFSSFLLTAKMEAKLFAFPISRKVVIGLISGAGIIFLLLVQLDPSVQLSIRI
ncbi:uncharacterized protein [Oscarella lobularis]|uniref:uncharacterized protein isoform X2 n=1 Tax=Oscarella lobularis TaxID=121494 RepID=UPI0033138A9C